MDLDKFEPLGKEEEEELVRRGQAGDDEARNKVVMGAARMAWGVAWKYSSRNSERAHELFSEIISTLCNKFFIFDLTKGNRFITWARFWMVNTALRYRMNHDRLIRVPVHLQGDGKLRKEDFRRQYVEKALRVVSLDAPVAPGLDVYREAEDWKEPDPLQTIDLSSRQELVRTVLEKIHPRYRQIMERFGKDLTLEEMGKEMGVSRERVRQLEVKAVRKFLQCAERINKPLMQEIEQDICNSNRFRGVFLKERRAMEATTTNRPAKKDRLIEVMRSLGRDAKGKEIRQIVEAEGYKVFDSDLSMVRKILWGGAVQTAKKQNMTAVSDQPNSYEALKTVNTFAKTIGGIRRLHELTTFLVELTA